MIFSYHGNVNQNSTKILFIQSERLTLRKYTTTFGEDLKKSEFAQLLWK